MKEPAASDGLTLAVSTCGPQLEVALAAPAMAAVSLIRLGGVAPRSTLVLAAADLMMEDAGRSAADIATVVVSRGPGSFTGIRAGLATVAGLESAVGAVGVAYDSLLMQAARCGGSGRVWSAQPGRRGEIYAQPFTCVEGRAPVADGEIVIMAASDAARRGPWAAAEALDLGDAALAATIRSAAEALLFLASAGVEPGPFEPLYVEGPPVHGGAGAG